MKCMSPWLYKLVNQSSEISLASNHFCVAKSRADTEELTSSSIISCQLSNPLLPQTNKADSKGRFDQNCNEQRMLSELYGRT